MEAKELSTVRAGRFLLPNNPALTQAVRIGAREIAGVEIYQEEVYKIG